MPGPDLGGYDTGIADYGVGNRITANEIRGFQLPIDTSATRATLKAGLLGLRTGV
jgi:hypothetical protein